MKKTLILALIVALSSCGIKKELTSTQQENIELQKRLTELESEQSRLESQNQRLYNQNQDYRRRISRLQEEQAQRKTEVVVDDEVPSFPSRAPKIDKIFSVVEQMPQFPGGETKLYEFISKKMKYPSQAKESGVQGKVYVQFVVNTVGEITNAKVIRGIGSGCDQEALRIVKMMPKWKPGIQRGKPVNVKFILPFNFSLR